MVVRTLITTADKETWPKDKNEPVLFLGEWCKSNSQNILLNQMNYEVASYHWDDRKKLYQDYNYLQKIYEKTLINLSNKLNSIHDVNYELRYWRIFIGPWLNMFIQILFDRWSMIDKVVDENQANLIKIIVKERESITSLDFSDAKKMYISDDWNEMIYGELISKFFDKKLSVLKLFYKSSKINNNPPHSFGKLQEKKTTSLFVNLLNNSLQKFSKYTNNDENYFFKDTYLFLFTDLKLQLRLKQFPLVQQEFSMPHFNFNVKMRQWDLNNEANNDAFETVLNTIVPMHIPMAYLEGYLQLLEGVNKLSWPKKPKAIFTSNPISDDIFKLWVAEKVHKGAPLIIGQHGGNYGMNTFNTSEKHQFRIADKWLSWGWSAEGEKNVTPIGNLIALNHLVKHNPNGGALMVEMNLPRYSYDLLSMPIAGQFNYYFEDQKSLIDLLPKKITQKLTLRLFHNDYERGIETFWRLNYPDINIDSGGTKISSLIKNCKIYISTYNATTYLLSLTWNIPTIIFWNPKYWELNEEASHYIKMLESVGIFHDNPEAAAKKISEVWEDIPSWWESQEVQDIRLEFCKKYSYIPGDSLNQIETLFKEIVQS